MDHIAVIGAGQAGASLCEGLRKGGYEGRITLWGAEPALPYQRPPLSKAYLLGDMAKERLFLRPETYWDEQGVELRMGTEVTAIDPTARRLTHTRGVEDWDALALTTGSEPRRLPARLGGDLDGVYTLRDLADVEAISPRIIEGQRLLVVGGGYIGLEMAAVAASRGLDVTLVEAADRLLARVACRETAAWFAALHRGHGVDIREGVGLERLVGDGAVTGAVLADGTELAVDTVVCGIGIEPRTDLAQAAGLIVANGIAVDEFGATSAPGIWAAGDCASFPWHTGRIRLESVPHAIEQAEAVAANILGAQKAYQARPWFWSDQYDVKLQIAGLNSGYDRVVVRQTEGSRSHWYYGGETLLAVDAMNDARSYMVAKRLIEAGRSADPVKVADPSVAPKDLL